MGRPSQTQDRLDALLDGRPGEVTDDLAPLLAAAEALRFELADIELDPAVVDRHLEQALDRPATVVTLPVRKVGSSVLRRRVAAVALAAALVLVPANLASAASASALPGQALYPVKLAVEQFHLATVQWSPTREAQERARIAAKRLEELDLLVQFRMFRQVPPAIRALDRAVAAAKVAIVKAAAEEGADPELVAVVDRLESVAVAQHGELVALKKMESQLPRAINLAVQKSPAFPRPIASPVITPPPVTTLGPTPTEPPATTAPPPTDPEPTSVPTTQPEPATTAPPPTEPATTAPPPTEPPPTTVVSEGGSPAGAGGEGSPTSSTIP